MAADGIPVIIRVVLKHAGSTAFLLFKHFVWMITFARSISDALPHDSFIIPADLSEIKNKAISMMTAPRFLQATEYAEWGSHGILCCFGRVLHLINYKVGDCPRHNLNASASYFNIVRIIAG